MMSQAVSDEVAQLVERRIANPRVEGSIPSLAIIRIYFGNKALQNLQFDACNRVPRCGMMASIRDERRRTLSVARSPV